MGLHQVAFFHLAAGIPDRDDADYGRDTFDFRFSAALYWVHPKPSVLLAAFLEWSDFEGVQRRCPGAGINLGFDFRDAKIW